MILPANIAPGQWHYVPTIKGKAVLLPAHVDRESPQFGLHVHIDRRFHRDIEGAILMVTATDQPVMRWMECITASPTPYRHHEIEALEIYHRSCRVGADGRCPHQGLPVAAGRLLADGSRVCPGHGLRWAADGRLIAGDAAEAGLWSCGRTGEIDTRAGHG